MCCDSSCQIKENYKFLYKHIILICCIVEMRIWCRKIGTVNVIEKKPEVIERCDDVCIAHDMRVLNTLHH